MILSLLSWYVCMSWVDRLPRSLELASPNDIHNSEKLRNPFWSGSAILIAAPLYVSCKNTHPQSKFRPIALQRTSNWSPFVLLFNSAGKNNHFFKILPFFGVLAAFYKFHWTSKVYATFTMGNSADINYLGCICRQNSHTTVATSKSSGHCKRVSLQYSHFLLKLTLFPLGLPKDLSWSQK